MATGDSDDGDVRADVPDMLVGIGNAGKQVVYEFMRTDWILEEGIEPRNGEIPNFDAYVIDTDRKEQETDEATVQRINENIEDVAEDVGQSEQTLNTELEYINQLDGLGQEFDQPAAFTEPATVRKIAKGLKSWWMENSDKMLVDDYQKGVLRRRALSKALFHASNSGPGQNPLRPVLNPSVKEAYIVVGLGGGTGSGMFLDVAREMARNVDTLHLFGVIPAGGEKDRKLANAYAALSELEYLSRHEISPFKNVVLLPFGGLEDGTSDSEQQEFDEAVANAIMAHQNLGSNDDLGTDAGPPDYAPFSIAIPQILRYSAGDADEANEQVLEFISTRLDALEDEHELYDALEAYIDTHFDGEEAAEYLEEANEGTAPESNRFSLDTSSANALRGRFDDLVEMLGGDVLDALGYDPADDWGEKLNDEVDTQKQGTEEGVERNEAIVTEVPKVVRATPDPGERYDRERKYRRLDEFVQRELRAIHRRANLYRAVSFIEDDDLAMAIKNSAMSPGTTTAPVAVNEKISGLSRDINDIEDNKEKASKFKQRLEAETLGEQLDAWKAEVRSTVEQLVETEWSPGQLKSDLKDLDDKIQNAVGDIEGADRSRELDSIDFSFDFEGLNQSLEEVGIEKIDGNSIERSLDGLRRAHQVKLEAEERGGGVRRLLSFLPGVSDPYEDDKEEFGEMLGNVDPDLFKCPEGEDDFGSRFYCKYAEKNHFENMADGVEDPVAGYVDEVVAAFEDRIANQPVDRTAFRDEVEDEWAGDFPGQADIAWSGDGGDYVSKLRSELQSPNGRDADDLLADLIDDEGGIGEDEGGPVYEGLYRAIVGPVDDLLADLEARREDKQRTFKRYDELSGVIEDSEFPGREPRRLDVDFEQPNEDGQYINRIDTEGDTDLLQHDTLTEAGLHQNEKATIGARLRQFAGNVAQTDGRFPLHNGTLALDNMMIPEDESAEQGILYNRHQILPMFMGRAFKNKDIGDYDPDGEIEGMLRDTIAAQDGEDGYTPNTCGFGGPWDTSLVTFVGGVFLDNLRPVREASGYREKYFQQRDELVESIKARHAHGLDGLDRTMVDADGEGAYVYRDPLIDLDDPDELRKFIDADEETQGDIFVNNTETPTFDSTVDLDDTN